MHKHIQHHLKKAGNSHKVLSVFLILAGLAGVVLVGLVILLVLSLGGISFGNKAKKDFEPIRAQLKPLNAKFICENGDGGRGMNNSTPWYTAYYLMPKSNVQFGLNSVIAGQGFNARKEKPLEVDQYAQGYNALQAHYQRGSTTLQVTVVRSGDKYEVHCAKDVANARKAPDANNYLVELQIQEPTGR